MTFIEIKNHLITATHFYKFKEVPQTSSYLIIVISPISFHNQLKKNYWNKVQRPSRLYKNHLFSYYENDKILFLMSLTSCLLSDSAGEMIKSRCARNKCLPTWITSHRSLTAKSDMKYYRASLSKVTSNLFLRWQVKSASPGCILFIFVKQRLVLFTKFSAFLHKRTVERSKMNDFLKQRAEKDLTELKKLIENHFAQVEY